MSRQPMSIEEDIASTTRINEASSAAPIASTSKSAQPSGPSFAPPLKLEPFLLLAKSARGAGAAKLIEEVTAAQGVYVFGELLDMPPIKDLAKLEQYAAHYRMLELFAYGTWKDYSTNSTIFPPMKEAHIAKLKQLSLVTLAGTAKILPYSTLMQQLDVASVRELEDLVIEAIYAEILRGRLDQRNSRLAIDSVSGRDVQNLSSSMRSLASWADSVGKAIHLLEQKIAIAKDQEARAAAKKTNDSRYIAGVLQDISATNSKDRNDGPHSFLPNRSPTRPARGGGKEHQMTLGNQPFEGDGNSKTRKRNRG